MFKVVSFKLVFSMDWMWFFFGILDLVGFLDVGFWLFEF
jgi:hypothetical protein